ncbi:MAG: Mth938-like domain-containing protein [Archaeoglobaceae archaeon]
MIERYEFGKIVVNGRAFTSDILIFDESVRENWWRKEGHKLSLEDLREVLEFKPEILIIGTGYNGRMVVPEEVKKFLEEKGIKAIVLPTQEAVKVFNETKAKKVGAFHLTC